ncbi:MAG TPA: hypothetical protein VFC16_09000 [Nakamurella sp.]|nr:hypothetical protein [Nakamurella sp.]
MTVHLHIDHIVLYDQPNGELSRAQLQQAVQQELGRTLTESALHSWAGPGVAVPDLPAVSVNTTPKGLPAGIANGVAGALSGLAGGRK